MPPDKPSAASVTLTAGSTITLAECPATSVCGRLVTFTATVTAVPPAAGIPSGRVTFVADSGPATSVTLHDGVATFSTPLGAGAHTVTASYPGDVRFNGAPPASLTTRIWRAGFPDPAEGLVPDQRSGAYSP